MSRIHLGLGGALLLAIAAPVAAQSDDEAAAAAAIAAGQEAYGPQAPQTEQPDCKQPEGNEIVVCARLEEQSQFRVRSDEDAEDDFARDTMNRGNPKTPNVDGIGIFQGPATVGDLCIPGLQKCPPPPAYMVDFSALPEAPAGSDADRIGRGLAPRGDEGTAPPPPPAPEAKQAAPSPAEQPPSPPGTVPLEVVTGEPED